MIKYLWASLLFCLLLSSCEKKLDKTLAIAEGRWLVKMTTTTVEQINERDYSEYKYYMYNVRFDEGGTGSRGAEVLNTDFTWKLKGDELQLSYEGILPYKLISKSKDKMLWERSYKASLDYRTYTDTLELTRL